MPMAEGRGPGCGAPSRMNGRFRPKACAAIRASIRRVAGSVAKAATEKGLDGRRLDLRQGAEYIIGRLPKNVGADFKCKRPSR